MTVKLTRGQKNVLSHLYVVGTMFGSHVDTRISLYGYYEFNSKAVQYELTEEAIELIKNTFLVKAHNKLTSLGWKLSKSGAGARVKQRYVEYRRFREDLGRYETCYIAGRNSLYMPEGDRMWGKVKVELETL